MQIALCLSRHSWSQSEAVAISDNDFETRLFHVYIHFAPFRLRVKNIFFFYKIFGFLAVFRQIFTINPHSSTVEVR